MTASLLGEVAILRTNSDWIPEPWDFCVGSETVQDDFTGCSIVGGFYTGATLALDLSTTGGRTVIALPNRLNIRVHQTDVAALAIRDYQLSLVLVNAGGQKQDLLVGVARVQTP